MKTQFIMKWGCLVMILLGNILISCTKYDTPLSVEEGQETTSRLNIKKYVLWVNLEGAGGGDLVKNAFPDDGVIKGLLPHSRYAWSGMESEHADDYMSSVPTEEHAVACASMLTGNIPMRHGITDNTYISEYIFNPEFNESMKAYPGFFQYIVDYDKTIKTLAITPWKEQNEKLLDKASRVVTSSDDDETLNTALQKINEEDNRIIYLSFRSVLDAAKQGGWQAGNSGYIDAMHKMDGYVGQLLDAIKARPDYYYEDWLVMITSNHGGTAEGSYGGMSYEERNMFGIFYYEHFSQSKEMTAGMIDDEVLRFDQKFQGVVIDSITRTAHLDGIARMRHIYSMDSLSSGMTVEYIMAARPSDSRSYVCSNNERVYILQKRNWQARLENSRDIGSNSSPLAYFIDTSDGTWQQRTGGFLNSMIHTSTATMSLTSQSDVKTETVPESYDNWGNLTPAYKKTTYQRRGKISVYNYYDGLKKNNSTVSSDFTKESSYFADNNNLILADGLQNSCRYFLEIRIWNKALSDAEVKEFNDKLKLTKANCAIYDNLIGYWQFYKDKEGEQKYLKEDSIVVNQIKEVQKRIKVGDKEETIMVPTEDMHLRKKIEGSDKYYTHIDANDIQYMKLTNTMYQTIESKGRMMESIVAVPVILQWMDISYPMETANHTGSSAFRSSKLDGAAITWDAMLNKAMWTGLFLGDYSYDMEWRDREK